MTPDTITILQAHGRRLTKLWKADGSSEGYDSAKHYDLYEVPVDSLDAMEGILHKLIHRPDCAVVRGAIANPEQTKRARRLMYPDPETGDAATLREGSHHWLSLDLDGVPLPAEIDRHDLAACVGAVLPMLPTPLHQAELIVQATASHIMKPGARLRLWGWCSRALSGAECRRWFQGVPVDASLFRAAQVNYTAAPIFAAGATDPLRSRIVRLPGQHRIIQAPSVAALAPVPRPAASNSSGSVSGGSRYALAALTRACGNIARQPEGTRHPTAVAEAWGLARLVKGGLLTESEVARAVDGALRSAGKPDGEGQAIVAWAVAQRSDTGNLPAGGRP
jgi:hypothetical protein